MKILAISGSLHSRSSNTAILREAIRIAPHNMHIHIYEGLGDLPHFSPERDFEQSPDVVKQLRAQVADADGVIICTPEYAFGMPGSLKNLLDWTVSSGEFVHKPTAAWSASPSQFGGSKAHAWLVQTLTVLTGTIVEAASLNIPFIKTRLDANGEVAHSEVTTSVMRAIEALEAAILAGRDMVE